MESGVVSVAGFGLGIVVMFSMRALAARLEKRAGSAGDEALPVGMIGATAVDFLIDAVILGAARCA